MNREEILARRLERRERTRGLKVAFTPFPISSFGSLRYMFPTKGQVRKLVVYVDEMPRSGVDILVELGSKDITTTTEFKTREMFVTELVSPMGEVDVGDKLCVLVEPTNPEEEVGTYWVSALWVPHKSSMDMIKFLDSELDKLVEEGDAEETT